jgi:hypothetical protein
MVPQQHVDLGSAELGHRLMHAVPGDDHAVGGARQDRLRLAEALNRDFPAPVENTEFSGRLVAGAQFFSMLQKTRVFSLSTPEWPRRGYFIIL